MIDSEDDSADSESEDDEIRANTMRSKADASWRIRFGIAEKGTNPERKESEQTQTTSEPPTYEQARKQAITEKK